MKCTHPPLSKEFIQKSYDDLMAGPISKLEKSRLKTIVDRDIKNLNRQDLINIIEVLLRS